MGKRISEITLATDREAADLIPISNSTDGTRGITPANFDASVAAQFRADPTTYRIPYTDSVSGKLHADFLPTLAERFRGFYDAPDALPTFPSDGDFVRVTTAGNLPISGSPTVSVNDEVWYYDSAWTVVPEVVNLLKGKGTAATARAAISAARANEWAADTLDNGLAGDGTTDDGPALQALVDTGVARISFRRGTTTKTLQQITLQPHQSLYFEPGAVLDSSAASFTGATITTGGSSLTALPDLASNVSKGSDTLTFDSAPSVEVNDVIIIYDPTNGSYHAARDYYRKGEMLVIKEVDGTTVKIVGQLLDDYSASVVTMHKVTNPYRGTISGARIKCRPSDSDVTNGITIENGLCCRIEDCEVWGASESAVNLYRCFGATVEGIRASDDHSNDFSLDYGIKLLNSSHTRIRGCNLSAARHGLTFGGTNGAGDVPSRFNVISGCSIYSTETHHAFNFHGNCEYTCVTDCLIHGGLDLSGNFQTFTGCTIFEGVPGNTCVLGAELSGYDHVFDNCRFESEHWGDSDDGAIVDTRLAMTDDMTKGGTLCLRNCLFEIRQTTDDSTGKMLMFKQRNYTEKTAYDQVSVEVSGCTFRSRGYSGYAIAVELQLNSSDPWEMINVRDCTFHRTAAFTVTPGATGLFAARRVRFHGNTINDFGLEIQPVLITGVQDCIDDSSNEFHNVMMYSILQGQGSDAEDQVKLLIHRDNVYYNTPWGRFGSFNSSARFRYARDVVDRNNNIFNYARKITVADASQIPVGSVITGGTSGVTATVYQRDTSNNWLMIKESASGTFTTSETLTNDQDAGTTTVSAGASIVQSTSVSISTGVTNCYNVHNIARNGTSTMSVEGTPSGTHVTDI